MEGSKEFFISRPSYKDKNDEYKNFCNPITKEFNQQMYQDIMETYNALVAVTENIEKWRTTGHQTDYSINEDLMAKGGAEFMETADDDCP